MVFSDDILHFLKIKKEISWIHQNYLVALIMLLSRLFYSPWNKYNHEFNISYMYLSLWIRALVIEKHFSDS